MGVNIPDNFRGGLAMAGEWTVTSTRVVQDPEESAGPDKKATGVRKREAEETEEGREVVCGFGLGRAVACGFISEYELGFECECECGFGFGFE